MAPLRTLLCLLGLVAGGASAAAATSCAAGAASCPSAAPEEKEALEALFDPQAADAAVEAALAETALLQRRLADAGKKTKLTADQERLMQSLHQVRRDKDWAKFLEKTKDIAGIMADAGDAKRSAPKQGTNARLHAMDLSMGNVGLKDMGNVGLKDLADAPSVTLPSGATVKGSMLPGLIVNASMLVEGMDMSALVQSYAGIRYATAERFRPPELYEYARGTEVDGTQLGPKCAQSYYTKGVLDGDEDCLFANVYSPPGTTSSSKKPVIVWIHGGNLVFGGIHQYHGILNWLAVEGDVIMVSINYRLNVFGFFYSPEGGMKANFGNRDQIKGLEWVQKNIGAFGGDKDRVTIMGQSGGGRSVSVLYMSPMSVGLFHRAIAQSPGALDANYFQPIQKVGATMGSACQRDAGCEGKGVECMRTKTTEELNAACSIYTQPSNYLASYGFYMSGYDGEVLPHKISAPLCMDTPTANNNIPMMSGSLANEWTYFDLGSEVLAGVNMVRRLLTEHLPAYQKGLGVREPLEKILFGPSVFGGAECQGTACSMMSDFPSLQMASNQYGLGVLFPLHGQGTGKRYRYDLNIDLAGSALGSGHCGEMCLLFGGKPWILPFQKGPCGDGGHQDEWLTLAPIMRQYWTSFARDGYPHAQGQAEWKEMVQGRRTPLMSFALGKAPIMSNQAPFSAESEAFLLAIMCTDEFAFAPARDPMDYYECEEDVDYTGKDLAIMPDTDTVDACAAACRANEKCHVFVSKSDGQCFLKEGKDISRSTWWFGKNFGPKVTACKDEEVTIKM